MAAPNLAELYRKLARHVKNVEDEAVLEVAGQSESLASSARGGCPTPSRIFGPGCPQTAGLLQPGRPMRALTALAIRTLNLPGHLRAQMIS